MKVPYPADLSSIETAVWGAEYVRVRAARSISHPSRTDDIAAAIEAANRAVDDLRHAREHS